MGSGGIVPRQGLAEGNWLAWKGVTTRDTIARAPALTARTMSYV
jgi:hypothetical protein